MILRIEFGISKSPTFKRMLGVCRQMPGFSETTMEGETIYRVDFTEKDFESAQALMYKINSWKSTVYYLDGKFVDYGKAWGTVFDVLRAKSEEKRWQDHLEECARLGVKPIPKENFGRGGPLTIKINIPKPGGDTGDAVQDSTSPDDFIRRCKKIDENKTGE